MINLWYNNDMDAETPQYFIYDGKQRIGWIKNVDDNGYIDEILIYNDYRNMGYGKQALEALRRIQKRDLILDVKTDNIQAMKCYLSAGFKPCSAFYQNKNYYIGMRLPYYE